MLLNLSAFFRFAFLLSGMAMLYLTGCSKKESDPVDTNVNEVKATINGQGWQAKINNTATNAGLKQIFALKADGSSLRVYFPEDSIATYDLATDNSATVAYYLNDVFWNTEISGSLEVTQNTSDVLEGSFNAHLISIFNNDTVAVENGTFSWHR